jgi:predicted transcriptional regulator
MERGLENDIFKCTTEIVVALIEKGGVDAAQAPALVRQVREALDGCAIGANLQPVDGGVLVKAKDVSGPEVAKLESSGVTLSVEESINDEYLVCFEDGQRFRSLRRHLMAKYGLTPEQYRSKWGLPVDYPMVAPSYARERSEVAKRTGLGRTPAAKELPNRRAKTRAR